MKLEITVAKENIKDILGSLLNSCVIFHYQTSFLLDNINKVTSTSDYLVIHYRGADGGLSRHFNLEQNLISNFTVQS